MSARSIEFAGETLQLLSQRAAFRVATRTLLVADLHVGKASAFRAAGVPVPAGTTTRDLSRLSSLLASLAPRELVLLGDLLHARSGRSDETMAEVSAWRRGHASLPITLVRGNHDRSAGDPPLEWAMRVVAGPWEQEGIAYAHEPADDPATPTLAGHVHPVAVLSDFDGGGVRVPCFVVDPRQVILPAFGSFTGGQVVPRAVGRRLFGIGSDRVVPLPETPR
jgi:DNA ligase-associated metallophosphoesterase